MAARFPWEALCRRCWRPIGAGMRTVVLSARNERDLDELPADVRGELEFVLVNDVSQALKVSLVQDNPAVRQAA